MIKTIAILGAGHGGAAAAADLTRRGFAVRLHGRRSERLAPFRAAGGVEVRGVHEGFVPLAHMTTEVGEAVRDADLVMLVVPSDAHAFYAEALAPLLSPDIPVFLNPGHTGGGLHFVHELRKAGYSARVQTCESVSLTYICRMEGPATVGIYSYTKRLAFAAFPGKNAHRLFTLMQPVYPELTLASSVLETALTNLNAVFHPPGMVMNTGWIEHTGGNFLFYREGITEGIGRVTAAVDAERIAIARALELPVRTFLEVFYQAGLTTRAAFESGSVARACRESEPNFTLKSPPSLAHRYVNEDVGYGLVPIAAFGELAGIKTPVIDALVTLASSAAGIDFRKTGLTLEKMGLAGRQPASLKRFLDEGD
ncbi:MAG: NAD/NADP octopine/nopaline dehydrogenase family protein [Alphaproteobacteria bacterium]